MTTHKTINRIAPPMVVLGIVGCVWYATTSQPQPAVALPGPQHVAVEAIGAGSGGHAVASQEPIADVAPTVNKLGSQVRFSVNTAQFKQVQKVEFYVETKMVGAVFSQPYTVSVDENNLTAGTHSVTAKVYTSTATAQTTPALFTANPARPVAPDPAQTDDTATPGGSTTPKASDLASPTALSVVGDDSGTTAQLTWAAAPPATAYQVWRDGAQIATVTTTRYTNTGLNPGQTYDYYLIAVSGATTSNASDQVAVTMATPYDSPPPLPPGHPGDDGTTTDPPSTTPVTDQPSDTSADSQTQ